jgi:hypothetical protein
MTDIRHINIFLNIFHPSKFAEIFSLTQPSKFFFGYVAVCPLLLFIRKMSYSKALYVGRKGCKICKSESSQGSHPRPTVEQPNVHDLLVKPHYYSRPNK